MISSYNFHKYIRYHRIIGDNGRVLPKWRILLAQNPLKALMLNNDKMFIKCTFTPTFWQHCVSDICIIK